MRQKAEILVVACMAGLLLCLPIAASSQVEPVGGVPDSENLPPNRDSGACTNGIIEGPDPIGAAVECEKNAKQDTAEPVTFKMQPAIGYHRADGSPFLVWSESNSGDHDVAYRSWQEGSWGPVEYLTNTVTDERDPTVWVGDDGAVHVAWWSEERGIEVTRRDATTGEWSANRQVSARGLRPAIATLDGRVFVVFERSAGQTSREIVVATEAPWGGFDERVVSRERAAGALGVGLERDGETLRLGWTRSDGVAVFTELHDAQWSTIRSASGEPIPAR